MLEFNLTQRRDIKDRTGHWLIPSGSTPVCCECAIPRRQLCEGCGACASCILGHMKDHKCSQELIGGR